MMASPCVHKWHRRLAHRFLRDIKRLGQHGLSISPCMCNDQCEACEIGKSTIKPFPTATKPDNVLDIIVSDVCGLLPVKSFNGAIYFQTIIDVCSDYTEVKLLKSKDDTNQFVIQFVEMVKTQLKSKPKIFKSDNGGEYVNHKLTTYLQNKGIIFQNTVPHCPQQNGISERKNRTLMDATRTVMHNSGLPQTLWQEAIKNVIYTQNRIVRKDETLAPIEIFFNSKVSKPFFMEFGYPVFATTIKSTRNKLSPRATVMKFLNVDSTRKGFRLWDGSKIIVNRNIRPKTNLSVTFSETRNAIIPETESAPVFESKPLRRSERLQEKSNLNTALTTSSDPLSEPRTYKQALKCVEKDEWISAMNEELEALKQTGTYENRSGWKSENFYWKKNDEVERKHKCIIMALLCRFTF